MSSTIDAAAGLLARGLGLLERYVRIQTGPRQLLANLGWTLPPGVDDIGLAALDPSKLLDKLRSVNVAVAAKAGSFEVDARYAELGAELAAFLSRLRGLGAALQAPGDFLARTNVRDELLPRLIDFLVVQLVVQKAGFAFHLGSALGLLELTHYDADPAIYRSRHLRCTVHWDRLPRVLTDHRGLLRDVHGWGTPAFDPATLTLAIGALLRVVSVETAVRGLPRRAEELLRGVAVPEADTQPATQVFVNFAKGLGLSSLDAGVSVYGLRATTAGAADGGLGFTPFAIGTTDRAFRVSSRVSVELDGTLDLQGGVAVLVRAGSPPTARVNLTAAAHAADAPAGFRAGLRLRHAAVAGRPMRLLELPGGTRLQCDELAVAAGARPSTGAAEFFVEVQLTKARFVLDLGGAAAVLRTLIPKDVVQADLDLAIGWAAGKAYLRGSTELRATFPVGLSVGPIDLQSVSVGLSPGAGGIPVEISATLEASVGPLTMTVEHVGLTAAFDFKGGSGGNLGPLQVELAFKPPDGIGLSVDAGPVSGGGFLSLDPRHDRYAGVLELELSFVNAVAFGIYEEVEGRSSFVAVLGARFNPGIQLGFGFALTGVGGLVALNRRANVDALRDRLATGASGNVLFCEDPVKNAPAILGDLGLFFPPAAGGFLVGPTVQIGWLSPIVRLDLGILIEFPGPSKIVILGTVRAVLGLGDSLALLYLRMDVLGVVDFEQRLVAIDASLVASHALGVFRLTGGMAFRLGYGGNPYVLLSIGGFHPRFDPGPLAIPRLARVGASLDVSVVADLYVRVELYTAFTSNTLQAGAKVEAGMELGPLSAHGFFQFDALIQFRPFRFEVDFSAGFAVEALGFSFASVDIDGRISGPGPVVVHARGTVRRFGLKASGSATFELGSHDGDRPAPIAHPVLELAPELQQVANLRADGEDRAIVPRPGRPAVQGVLVSPLGSLIWEQKRAPLNTIIHRLGGVPLDAQHELRLDPPPGWSTSEERDWFNPGAFTDLDLKASQTLNEATFQELPSGIRVGSTADVRAPAEVDYEAELDLVKRPTRSRFASLLVGTYLGGALHATLLDRTATPAADPGPAKVSVHPETADVHAADGTLLHAAQTPFQAFQLARQGAARLAVPTTDVTVNL